MTIEQTLLSERHINLSDIKNSQDWFDNKVRSLRNITPLSMMRMPGIKKTIRPGGLYSFYYHPKGAAELPYWDTFPMIFPLSSTKETFYGLNMHYLPHKIRFQVFKELLRVGGDPTMTSERRLNLQWEVIQGISKLRYLQFCIKQYRYDHVESPFLEINKTEWATALMLPVHRFVGNTAGGVWSRARKA